MDLKKQPGISFNNIMLVKEKFNRDFNVPKNPEIKIDLKTNSIKDNNDSNKFQTEMTVILILTSENKEVLTLESTFIGLFSIVSGQENMSFEEFSSINAPALMFPYIREHITAITQKSGIKPVILQPINFIALNKEPPQIPELDRANN